LRLDDDVVPLQRACSVCGDLCAVRRDFRRYELEAAMTSSISWRTGVTTDSGLQRAHNEDRVFVDESAGIFLVVDGIGGQAGGETAAEIAIRVIPAHLANREGTGEDRVREAIAAANNEIYHLAQLHEGWRGMACVLTLALADENDRVVVGHVGDSRLYLMRDGKLRKLTSDHSPVGEREDLGEISEREAMAHPRRNQVFRDVGSRPREASEENFIELHTFRFGPKTAFLLCSDGLSDAVRSAEIAEIIATYDGDAELVSRRLVDAANQSGGRDNISVVFVAGAEFSGTELAEARKRHAITRPRENRWRTARSRALWLIAGILTGAAALGAYFYRSVPERATPAARHIAVGSSGPRAIANALSVAQPGDTLEVAPGEYLGPIELRDEINLVSRQPGAAVIRVDPAAVADAGIAFAARSIHQARLSGFRVVGGKDAQLTTGVLVDGSDLEIDEMDISGAGDCAIRIAAGSKAVVRASDFHDNPGCGVWIGGGSSPRLAGNRIAANGTLPGALRPGIEIRTPSMPIVERNIIAGNGIPNEQDEIRRTNLVVEDAP
jgi:serine/threonine protein phosphatase PrpC